MRIAFIETSSITNEVLRAYADAHRLCVGYPDGVPETWRTVSAAQQGGGAVPDLSMKHFTDETRARIEARERAALAQMCPTCGGAGGGAAYPEHELDPAALGKCALCFFDGEPVCRRCGAVAESNSRSTYPMDPAALLGPAAEPVDWPERDAAGDEEC